MPAAAGRRTDAGDAPRNAAPTGRRRLLAALGSTALLFAVRGTSAAVAPMRDGELDTVRRIAMLYRRDHDDAAAIRHLHARGRACPAGLRRPALVQWLAGPHRADLEAGRMVVIAGWILTRSEARLCSVLAVTLGE
jgi:hypothetical protein